MSSVIQEWVAELTHMQQSVLLSAIRAADGTSKYHPSKKLVRWLRRCVLISALDKTIWTDPISAGGGSFTGPSLKPVINPMTHPSMPTLQDYIVRWEQHMEPVIGGFLEVMDELPLHFFTHFMHACQILGYKHPDTRIRAWWHKLYCTLVNELHLRPEPEEEMNERLSDNREKWLARSHPATSA